MLVAYWSAKGGSGTTVLAAAHALRSAAERPTLLVDLDGDLPAVLGVDAPATGVSEWLAAGSNVPTDALERIAIPVVPNLQLIGLGEEPVPHEILNSRVTVLAGMLATNARTVIADCGSNPRPLAAAVARAAHRSILVTRPCFLSMRRQRRAGLAPTEVAVVRDQGRAYTDRDIEDAVGAPVRLSVDVEPAIASAVDAGMLARRLPRALRRVADRAMDRPDSGTPEVARRRRDDRGWGAA